MELSPHGNGVCAERLFALKDVAARLSKEDTAQDKLPTDQSIADTTEDRPSVYPRPPFNIPG